MNEHQVWKKLRPYLKNKTPCIVCNGTDLTLWAQEKYLKALQCNDCGMISTNPHFSEEGLNIFYNEYLSSRIEKTSAMEQRQKAYILDINWVCNYIKSGRVLDIGASGGFFLSNFSPILWDREGVEIGEDAAKYAKDNFGLHVHTGKVEDMSFSTPFDLVMMRGVIEHIPDPIAVLRKCYEIISPEGYLFITAMPNGSSFAFDVFRNKWRQFTPLEHIHFFSRKLLIQIVEKIGFRVISHHYQYDETPYANPKKDYERMKEAINLKAKGKNNEVPLSPPFPETMLTIIFKKLS
jgi:2-polyprenyl-3-methyl-5-hydroxy-6-metoxy-1,4-benzoquinol methylase